MASNPSSGFEFNRPTVIALLYLASFVVGITGIVGVVLAYVWRGEAHEAWEETHYTYLIRTFWIALAAAVVGVLLMIVGVGFLILIALSVWTVARSVLSLINAQKRAPMPNPESLLL